MSDNTPLARYRVLLSKFKAEADAIKAKYAGTDIENVPWAWGKTDQARINRIASSIKAAEMIVGITAAEAQEERDKVFTKPK